MLDLLTSCEGKLSLRSWKTISLLLEKLSDYRNIYSLQAPFQHWGKESNLSADSNVCFLKYTGDLKRPMAWSNKSKQSQTIWDLSQ